MDLILSEQNKGKLLVSDYGKSLNLIFETAGHTTILGSYMFKMAPPKK